MTIRKALTFRASAIGDALNAKYLLENIHTAYPEARCGIVVAGNGAMLRDLLAAYPWIEVLEVNRRNLGSVWNLWKEFRGSDLVITPATKPGGTFALPSKLFARLLAHRLIGFRDASPLTPYLYDAVLAPDPVRAPRLLEQDALAAAHIPIAVADMTLAYLPQPELLARLGLDGKPYLVLHLFAGGKGRALTQGKRQSILDALHAALPEVPFVLTGSRSERVWIEELTLPPNARVVAGDISVQELAHLITKSTLTISIGTGPSHMASNLGARLIVLVVCIGRHWCGEEEFGDRKADHILSNVEACKNGHDAPQGYAPCIESIEVADIISRAVPYFRNGQP